MLTLLVAAVLTLTACAGGARADFAQQFRGDPAIEEFELTTGDNMPFTDGVRATVALREDLSDDEATALLSKFSAFVRDHSDEPVQITVREGTITIPVFGTESVTLQAREAAFAIATEFGVDSIALSATTDSERISGVSVEVSSDLHTAFSAARSAPERLLPLTAPAGPHITVKNADSTVHISGVPGRWLDDAEVSWTLVSAAVPISGVRAGADEVRFTLADEADAAEAQALIARAESAFQTPITFASPLVLLGLNGTGDEARLMLSELDDNTRSLILSVWSNDARAEFSVATADDVAGVEAALATLPASSRGALEVTVVVSRR